MSAPYRFVVGAAGWAGHVFPAFAVARELRARGHAVLLTSFERWREQALELDLEFEPGPERVSFPGVSPAGPGIPSLPDAARELVGRFTEFGADAVLHDLYTLGPALAADAAAIKRATMMPHPYPEPGGGEPPYSWGLMPPRTRLGAAFWKPLRRAFETRRWERGKVVLDELRAELGLAPIGSHNLMVSERLTMIATFPQLEYPRQWPEYMHVTGPPFFELPYADVELPVGDEPLVLVTASTEQDPELELLGATLEALADEPLRVIATTNRKGEAWGRPLPANARVYDWISYSQVLAEAALVVCRGGHGTLARALAAGVPVVVCPAGQDMPENATRAAWSGAGAMLPGRLLGTAAMRAAVRRVLGEPTYAARAARIGAWSRENDGAERIADLLERYAAQPR